MSSKVNVETVQMTAGINLPNSIIVQGGVDGAFFPANQIGWGNSTFMNSEFGGTSDGLLNLIENVITEDEEIIASALNDLNIKLTYYTAAETNLSARIDDLENVITEDERVIAKSLTDLNTRTLNLSTHIDDLENVITEDERVIAKSLTDLNTRTIHTITSYTTADANLSARINDLENVINEDKEIIATALTNLNTRTLNTITSYTAADANLSARIDVFENAGYATMTDVENYISTNNNDVTTKISELSEYDQFLLNKITELQSQLTEVLNRISTFGKYIPDEPTE